MMWSKLKDFDFVDSVATMVAILVIWGVIRFLLPMPFGPFHVVVASVSVEVWFTHMDEVITFFKNKKWCE